MSADIRRALGAALVGLVVLLAATACMVAPPSGNPLPGFREIAFLASSDPTNKRVAVFIDALDAQGRTSINTETGRPYPSDYTRTTPYTHILEYLPGQVITMSFTIIMAGEPGDNLRCQVFDNGVEIARPAPVPLEVIRGTSAKVSCIYTTAP